MSIRNKKVSFAEYDPLSNHSARESDRTNAPFAVFEQSNFQQLQSQQQFFSSYNPEQLLQFKSSSPLQHQQTSILPKKKQLCNSDDDEDGHDIDLDENGDSIATRRKMYQSFTDFSCYLMRNRQKQLAFTDQPTSADPSFFSLRNLQIDYKKVAENLPPGAAADCQLFSRGDQQYTDDCTNHLSPQTYGFQSPPLLSQSPKNITQFVSSNTLVVVAPDTRKDSFHEISQYYFHQNRMGESSSTKTVDPLVKTPVKIPHRGKKAMTLALVQNIEGNNILFGKNYKGLFSKIGPRSVQDILLRLSIRSSIMVYKFIRKLKKKNASDLSEIQHGLINDLSDFTVLNFGGLNKKYSRFSTRISFFFHRAPFEWALRQIRWFQLQMWSCLRCVWESQPIDPTTNWMITWLVMQLLFILVALFYTPLEIINADTYIKKYGQYWTLYKFINMLAFFFDIILKFNTGLFEKGQIVLVRKEIVQSYVNGNLLFDILALIPIVQTILNIDYLRPINVLILLKVQTARKIIGQIQETISQRSNRMQNALSVLQLLLLICSVCHVFACFFMGLAVVEEKYNLTSTNWMIVQKISGEDVHWFVKYTSALYFSVTTMVTVGYGDIAPVTFYETLFVTIAMLISCGIFAYSFNQIGDLVREQNRMSSEFKNEMVLVNRLLEKKKINRDLQIQVRKFLEFRFYAEPQLSMEEEKMVMSKLSHHLRDKVILESNLQILNQCSLFKRYFSPPFLDSLALKITELRVSKNEIIFEQSDLHEDPSLYIVDKGNIEIFVETDKGESGITILNNIQQGQYFGELSFFNEKEREFSARASDFTIVYGISRSQFIATTKEFPIDFEQFCFMKDRFMFGDKPQALNLICSSCKREDHHISQGCPMIHYVVDKEKTILKEIFSVKQPLRKPIEMVRSTSANGSSSQLHGGRINNKLSSLIALQSVNEVQKYFMDDDMNYNYVSINYPEFNEELSVLDDLMLNNSQERAPPAGRPSTQANQDLITARLISGLSLSNSGGQGQETLSKIQDQSRNDSVDYVDHGANDKMIQHNINGGSSINKMQPSLWKHSTKNIRSQIHTSPGGATLSLKKRMSNTPGQSILINNGLSKQSLGNNISTSNWFHEDEEMLYSQHHAGSPNTNGQSQLQQLVAMLLRVLQQGQSSSNNIVAQGQSSRHFNSTSLYQGTAIGQNRLTQVKGTGAIGLRLIGGQHHQQHQHTHLSDLDDYGQVKGRGQTRLLSYQQNKKREKEQLLAQIQASNNQQHGVLSGEFGLYLDKMKVYSIYYPMHNVSAIMKALDSFVFTQPPSFGLYTFKIRLIDKKKIERNKANQTIAVGGQSYEKQMSKLPMNFASTAKGKIQNQLTKTQQKMDLNASSRKQSVRGNVLNQQITKFNSMNNSYAGASTMDKHPVKSNFGNPVVPSSLSETSSMQALNIFSKVKEPAKKFIYNKLLTLS